jgi:putative ABC transport system permease protein
MMIDLLRDGRLAARNLLKAPGYSAAAVVTLALAIGATSALFSVVHTVLLKPLPIQEPERLVVCWETGSTPDQGVSELSYRNFRDWSTGMRGFSDLAAMGSSNWSGVLDGQGEPVRLHYTGVTASFFDTLGVRPFLGRVFRPDEDVPSAARVVVLNYGTWVRRFGSDPGVLGQSIRLDGEAHTIVGVMPRGFDFPRGAELWMPVVPILATSSGQWQVDALTHVGVLFAVGRLRDGVTAEQARLELDALARRLQSETAPRFGAAVVVTPFLDYLLGPVRPALWALVAAVLVLLLIACANVSGLLLTRVSLRRREDAVRLALGATRARLGRLWAAETAILALAGGGLGLLASSWIARLVVALGPDDVPRLAEVSIDLRVAVFTFVVVSATALLSAAAPVRQAGATDLLDALHDAARGSAGRRSLRGRSTLLTLQIGLAVTMLLAAGLVVRSFHNLRRLDLGFVPADVLTMTIDPRDVSRSQNAWFQDLLQRVGGLPGTVATGAVSLRPLALGAIGQGTWVLLEGQPETPEGGKGNPNLNYLVATPGYFAAMRIGLVHGRLFGDQDDARAPRVAIVSESTARRLWPRQDPIGKRLFMPTHDSKEPRNAWRTVVGVVRDVRYRGLDQVLLDVYDPARQAATTASDLVVRTSGDPLAMAAAVQGVARSLNRRVVIDGITTMDAIVSRALAPWRLGAWMLSLFAIVAFVLAVLGLFSLVSLDVAQRRHEFAIRLALGAERRAIVGGVLRLAGWRVLLGGALGLLMAIAAARGMRSLLFGVDVLDPGTYAVVVAVVAGVVALASYVPARRAAGVDPLALLRRE